MAHSYVQAHASELDAFRAFCEVYPETVLLVDTYDTLEGVRRVIRLAQELGERFRVRAVRLDSGDLVELAFAARRLLDDADLQRVGIFASVAICCVPKSVTHGISMDTMPLMPRASMSAACSGKKPDSE